jgi:endonuclease III
MKKRILVQIIGTLLDQYIPHPRIPLHHADPFTLLIAVLLSAQCTDTRVNQVTPKLFARAHTPEQLASLDPKEVESIIRSCGLAPTKARAIVALSQQLIEQHEGLVPSSLEDLEQLPGVGHKTASVVLAQAFHQPAFPVDTHIHRCAKRWHLSNGKSIAQTERDLKRLFPKKDWARRHLQIILFARSYCPARGHHKDQCPICSAVAQVKSRTTHAFPNEGENSPPGPRQT